MGVRAEIQRGGMGSRFSVGAGVDSGINSMVGGRDAFDNIYWLVHLDAIAMVFPTLIVVYRFLVCCLFCSGLSNPAMNKGFYCDLGNTYFHRLS